MLWLYTSHARYALALAHPMPGMLWLYIYHMPAMLYALAIYITCQLSPETFTHPISHHGPIMGSALKAMSSSALTFSSDKISP